MPRISSANVEQLTEARRFQEDKVASLTRYAQLQNKLAYSAKAEIDVASRRRMEAMQRTKAEQRLSEQIAQAEYAARHQERVTDQNNKLAAELERRKIERERKEREIQRICEESEELRELERRLKVAYMNKERAAQFEESRVISRIQREQEQAIEDQMEIDRKRDMQLEFEKIQARHAVSLAQKASLKQQMEEHAKFLDEAKEEAKRDKDMVDQIVAKIEAQDQRETEIREEHKAQTRKLIKDYEVQRRMEVEEKKRKEKEEEDQIRAHMQQMAAREGAIQQAKADKEAHQARMFAQIAEENEKKRAEEEEMQRLRDMLWEEEMEAARRAEDRRKKEKLAKQRVEMAQANQQMLAMKAEKMQLEAAEEQKLIQMMMDKFARDDELEREAERTRLSNRLQYQKEIEEQKQERMFMYESEKTAELAAVTAQQEADEYRREVVAEARRRLLAEHAARLNGFLPKGTVQSADELELLRAA